MSKYAWSKALGAVAEYAPRIGGAVDDVMREKDRRRQEAYKQLVDAQRYKAEQDRLAQSDMREASADSIAADKWALERKRLTGEMQQTEADRARGEGVRRKIGEAITDYNKPAPAETVRAPAVEPVQSELLPPGEVPEEKHAEPARETQQIAPGSRKFRDLLHKLSTDPDLMSNFDQPEVKNVFETVRKAAEDEEVKEGAGGGNGISGGTALALQLRQRDDPVIGPIVKASSKKIVDLMKAAPEGTYDPITIEGVMGMDAWNPAAVVQAYGQKVLGTDEALRLKRLAVPIGAQSASANEQAKTEANLRATKELPKTEVTELLSRRSQYANLDNASKAFKSAFTSPYIGKLVKGGMFRPNSPEFAKFITPLALSMNQYRKDNFGTAQSAAEIQNFLDVVNTDLAVSADVVKTQLDKVMSAMHNDYIDRTEAFKGNNYFIPDQISTIVRSGGGVSGGNSPTVPQPTPIPGSPAGGAIPTINSREEFAKLRSGDKYINGKTGKVATKP